MELKIKSNHCPLKTVCYRTTCPDVIGRWWLSCSQHSALSLFWLPVIRTSSDDLSEDCELQQLFRFSKNFDHIIFFDLDRVHPRCRNVKGRSLESRRPISARDSLHSTQCLGFPRWRWSSLTCLQLGRRNHLRCEEVKDSGGSCDAWSLYILLLTCFLYLFVFLNHQNIYLHTPYNIFIFFIVWFGYRACTVINKMLVVRRQTAKRVHHSTRLSRFTCSGTNSGLTPCKFNKNGTGHWAATNAQVRRGFLTPEEDGYVELVHALRRGWGSNWFTLPVWN